MLDASPWQASKSMCLFASIQTRVHIVMSLNPGASEVVYEKKVRKDQTPVHYAKHKAKLREVVAH